MSRRTPVLHVGVAMAERAGAVKKTAKSAIPAQTSQSGAAEPDAAEPAAPEAAPPTPAKKAPARKAPAKRAAPAKAAAAKATTPRATTAKAASAKAVPAGGVARATRSADETEKIRVALSERRDELTAEYEQTISEIAEMQRDRLTDSAGDDQADTGTKTFEREQEISLANSIRERITQVERALERLDGGQYGWCERCGTAIPAARLAAFPSATLCVSCKQLEERR